MPTLRIQVKLGQHARSFELKHPEITIGKAPGCTLRLDVPWLADRQLVIDNSPSLVRIKTCASATKAMLSSAVLTAEWALLPSPGRIIIEGPGNRRLLLDISYGSPGRDAAVVLNSEHADGPGEIEDAALTVTASPLDQRGWLDVGGTDRAAGQAIAPVMPAPRGSKKRDTAAKKQLFVVAGIFAILLLVLGALVFNQHVRSVEQARVDGDAKWVNDHLAEAHELIQNKDYKAALAALDAAEPKARKYPELSNQLDEILQLRNSQEIQNGAIKGMVREEGLWLAPEIAQAWKAARERDDPKIDALLKKAENAKGAKSFDEARVACEDALALMASHPVKSHPREGEAKFLLEQVKNEAIAGEMTAKGMILFNNKWVTKDEKYRLEQIAKGLVEYKGKWLSKDEAFAAQQQDKGLVFYDDKWMTPEEKLAAQGYVQFEGKWVKPEERDRILDVRDEAARQEQARLAAERKRLADERERARQAAVQTEKEKKDAYAMSQEFVKDQLKAPATAQFQAYGSNDVVVVAKDGWYIVKGVVDSQNSFGAMLRSTYYCKLKPVQGKPGIWNCDSVVFDH